MNYHKKNNRWHKFSIEWE